MVSPQLPAFVVERRAGLLDFWAVYESRMEHLHDTALDVALRHPDFAALVRTRTDQLREHARLARGLMRNAIVDGDWPPFIAMTRLLGVRYARLGVSFASWYTVVQVFRDRLIPALVDTYLATPARLTAALAATLDFVDFSIALVAEPYFETLHQERFRLLAESVEDYAFYMLDASGVVTSWNIGAQTLEGYTAAEIVGQHHGVMFTAAERDAGKPIRSLEIAAAAGRFEEEAPRVRKDGSQFWAGVVVTAIRGAESRLVGFATVVRDLTERQQGEAERRGLEDRFRALADATPDSIITADHHGSITYANRATETLFGRGPAELVGQPLTVLMPDRLRTQYAARLARYLEEREPRSLDKTLELPALRSDGTEIAVEMSIATWEARSGPAFAAIVRDISERKQIEATLEQRTHQLEDANRELEAFSYSVAHDLRAPLRGMSGFSQMLLEDHAAKLDGQGIAYLLRIQANVRRMGTLIDALFGLSRLSRGDLELQSVDLTVVARSVIAQLAAAEPRRDVDVSVEDGLRVTADPRLMRTLLENLIGNAWKFTARTPSPRIAVGSTDPQTFFVRDNGAGFDLVQAGKLFSPFERLHSADDFPGTGVGLATVQRIVHRHGGRIWVTAQVNAGATFFFTFAPAEP